MWQYRGTVIASLFAMVSGGAAGDGKSTLASRLELAGMSVADVPGDERHTRELVAAAARADAAVIVVDVRSELPAQARRLSCIACLVGVRHVVLAVNKMDLAGHDEPRFDAMASAFREFARDVDIHDVTCVPVSALHGDNVAERSPRMPWYRGPALVEHLASLPRREAAPTASAPVERADQFEATLIWLAEPHLLPGRDYLMKIGSSTVTATVTPLKPKVNFQTLEHMAATQLEVGEVGVAQLELDEPVAFEPYDRDPALGGFTLVDRVSREVVGAGMIRFALRRSQNVHWQAVDIDRAARAAMKGQRPCTLWFTGLSGAGKSTIANLVEKKLHVLGRHTYLLDGDNVRHGLCKDLGFTEAARVENIRRVSEVAKLMTDAGLVVITAFISPFRSERRSARALFPRGEFLEVFIDAPLQVAESRDPKGLYRKARAGDLKNFTGIDSPYEAPESPEIRIDTVALAPEEAAERIVEEMRRRGL